MGGSLLSELDQTPIATCAFSVLKVFRSAFLCKFAPSLRYLFPKQKSGFSYAKTAFCSPVLNFAQKSYRLRLTSGFLLLLLQLQ